LGPDLSLVDSSFRQDFGLVKCLNLKVECESLKFGFSPISPGFGVLTGLKPLTLAL
jgi:hypothetical protein